MKSARFDLYHFFVSAPPPHAPPCVPAPVVFHLLLRYFGIPSFYDYAQVCIFDKTADDKPLR